MDIDDAVRPIDPQEDARRYAQLHAGRRRGLLTIGLTLLHPLLALAGGAVLGGWHAQAPIAGAVGMLGAWMAARAVLLALGAVAFALEAPSLWARLRDGGRWHGASPGSGRSRGAFFFAVYALAFAAFAMAAGVVAGLVGDGSLYGLDLLAFGLLGLVLAGLTLWTEPS